MSSLPLPQTLDTFFGSFEGFKSCVTILDVHRTTAKSIHGIYCWSIEAKFEWLHGLDNPMTLEWTSDSIFLDVSWEKFVKRYALRGKEDADV